MDREARLLETAARHNWMVRESDIADAGLSIDQWKRLEDMGRWCQIVPGRYRHCATPLSFEMQVVAGGEWLGRRGALFGTTALRWLGVEVDEPPKAEFLVPRSLRSIPNWMTIHTSVRWSADDVILHRGVRTTTATRALIDMATANHSATDLESAIDSAIRLRRTALPRLQQRLGELGGQGRTGVVILRELLLDAGGESHLERRFLRLVRIAGLPRPQSQVAFRSDGITVARVDFQFGPRLVVEVSGRLGHSTDRDRQRDARRRNHLQVQGMVVLEFTTADVIDDPTHVLGVLHRQLPVAVTTTGSRGQTRDRKRG